MTEYPTQTELLSYLTTLAGVTCDPTPVPFRVDIIPAHGKPPMYSVMIKSPHKDRLRPPLFDDFEQFDFEYQGRAGSDDWR